MLGNNYLGPEDPIYGYLTLMVRSTNILWHQNAYIHVIIYIGFYVNTWC